MPQAFSQEQNKPICSSCELSAKGGASITAENVKNSLYKA
jgi:hypothetical protein